MSIVLQGSTSGSITLQEPAIAGSNTISLPAATGTAVLTGVSGTVDINAAGSNNVTLSTNSTERVRVDSSGNVGIGTSSPNEAMTIQRGAGVSAATTYRGNGVTASGEFYVGHGTDAIAYVYNRANQPLVFATNNTERMRITSAGVVELTSGQLKFPATQSASSDANTLDDYEEGSWTPTFTGSVSNPTVTYGDRIGRYTKVGNLVTVQCRIEGVSISGGSGQIRISGLPFTNASDTPTACIPMQQSTGINGRYSCAYLDPSLNYFTMWNNDPNSGYSTHNYPVTSTISFIFNLSYRV